MTDWQAVSSRIRETRESLGWTQEKLGVEVGSSANYVAQVEGGLAVSEKKLALYAAALGVSLPFLRYGVAADSIDVESIRRIARDEARSALLADLFAWLERPAASALPVTPAPIAAAPRHGPSVIQEPPADIYDQPIPRRRKPGEKQA